MQKEDDTIPYYQRWMILLGDALYLLPVLMIPIVFSGEFNTNTLIIKEPVLHHCIIFLLLWILISFFTSSTRSISFNVPVLILLVMVCNWIYLFFSKQAVANHPNGDYVFLNWTVYFLLFLSFALMTNSLHRLKLFAIATVFVSFIVCMYAILQTQEWFLEYDRKYLVAWDAFEWEMGGIRRVSSSLCNPDYLAGYLIAVFPLTVMTGVVYRGSLRYTAFGIAMLQVIALLFTYSRGGWISMFVTCLLFSSLFVYANWVRNPVLIPTSIKPKTIISLIVFGFITGSVIMIWQWDQVFAALYRIAHFGSGHSVSSRPYFYEGALKMIWDQPIFGHGIGMFGSTFPEFRSPELSRILQFNVWFVDHVHNEYLEIGAETGIVGLTLYVLLLFFAVHLIWKTMINIRIIENLLLLGLGCGIFATMFHNMFTVTLRFTPSAFLFWSFIGVAVGGACIHQKFHRINNNWLFRSLISLIILLPVSYLYGQSVRYFVGDHLIESAKHIRGSLPRDASVSDAREVMEQALAVLHKGNRLAPYHILGYWERANIYNNSVTDFVQANSIYLQVEKLNASFTSNLRNVCVNYMQQAKLLRERSEYFEPLAISCFREAVIWAKKAIELDPLEPEHHYLLGRCMRELMEFKSAIDSLNKAIELIPLMQSHDLEVTIQDCKNELEIIKIMQEHLPQTIQ